MTDVLKTYCFVTYRLFVNLMSYLQKCSLIYRKTEAFIIIYAVDIMEANFGSKLTSEIGRAHV